MSDNRWLLVAISLQLAIIVAVLCVIAVNTR
jgi:hypothetical protein